MALPVIVAGVLIGLLVGMTGIGGSAFMAPILILLFGVTPSTAVGTDLLYSIPVKWLGAWQHHRQGNVRWEAVKYLARGSIPGALVGAFVVTRWMRLDAAGEAHLKTLLGVVLFVVSLLILWHMRPWNQEQAFVRDVWFHRPGVMTAWGGVVGLLVGLTSVGSGSLLVPFLFLLPLGAGEVVGTDVAHAALLVTVAGLAYLVGGTVDLGMSANLLVGALPGVWLGARLLRHVPERYIRVGLAVLLLLTSLHLLGFF